MCTRLITGMVVHEVTGTNLKNRKCFPSCFLAFSNYSANHHGKTVASAYSQGQHLEEALP
jgi:hypothetical protein